MIAGMRRRAPLVLASACPILGLVLAMPGAASAADNGTPTTLTLDTKFVGPGGLTANDEPTSLRNCGAFPGSATANTDEWKFNQPAAGATVLAYTVGFIDVTSAAPAARVFGITEGGIVEIKPDDPTKTLPLTKGVSGALTEDGVRVGTPAGWRLAGGALQIVNGTGGGTFALTAVCLPATKPAPSSSSRSPKPSTTPPPRHRGAPAPSRSPSSTAPAGALPITGSRGGPLALTGLAVVLAGLTVLVVLRRRNRTRFQA
jgi:hypothetical protein